MNINICMKNGRAIFSELNILIHKLICVGKNISSNIHQKWQCSCRNEQQNFATRAESTTPSIKKIIT